MFTNIRLGCPACLSDDVLHDEIRSSERPLSVPGLQHSLCRGCGTVFLNPVPTAEELNAFYRSAETETALAESSQSAATRVLEADRREYFHENRVKPLLPYLAPGAPVFDVGCGVGAFVYAMRAAGFNAFGCDSSPSSIAAGHSILGLGDRIFEGDVHALPDSAFDLVTLWTVIEHLLDPEAYLLYLKKRRPGAPRYVLVEFPTTDSLMFEFLGSHFKWVMPPYHITLFSRNGMTSLLRRCGYEVVYTHLMPRNWYFLESVASKVGISQERMSGWAAQAPELGIEVDRIFDEISLRVGKSSTVWMLAASSEPLV